MPCAGMDPKALRAMLMANRGKLPAARSNPEPPAPVAPAGDEAARKRGAEDTDGPSSKRTRTASEPEAAANALLEELAAEQGHEQAPTDEEAPPGVRPSTQVCTCRKKLCQVDAVVKASGCQCHPRPFRLTTFCSSVIAEPQQPGMHTWPWCDLHATIR